MMRTQIQIIMHSNCNGEEPIEVFRIAFDIDACQYYLVAYISLQEMLLEYTISRDSINDLTETGDRKILDLYFRNNDTIESMKEHIEDVLRNANYLLDDENYHYVAKYLSDELEGTIKFLTGKEETIKTLELLP